MPIDLAANATLHVEWDDASGGHLQVADLERRADAALDQARRHVDVVARRPGDEHLEGLGDQLDLAAQAILEVLHRGSGTDRQTMYQLCMLVVDLQRLRSEQQEYLVGLRMRAVSATRRALDSTAGEADVDTLLRRAAIEVCRATGMDRSMVFRVDGHQLTSVATHFVGSDDWARACQEYAEANPLDLTTPKQLEAEMLRRQAAALVSEPMDDPRAFQPIVQKISTPGYVVVPVVVDGIPVATVHTDRYFNGPQVDRIDRDTAAGFAAGLAYALERTVLLDRLRAQRQAAKDLLQLTESTVEEFRASELRPKPPVSVTGSGSGAPAPRADWLDELTRRERDVLRLMVTGATNAAIARKLVVTEGTVKSHVKQLLRKTGTARRAEVLALYHRSVTQ